MGIDNDIRLRNPFHDLLVSELIDDPELYGRMFSERILVGETLAVFQPTNVVLTGPLGCGKSMILNLVRYPVLAEWIRRRGGPPRPLQNLRPYLGISINLQRSYFAAFGRRSASKAHTGVGETTVDAMCAADFINHFLFREFLQALKLLATAEGEGLRSWLGLASARVDSPELVAEMRSWDSWFGYYGQCTSLEDLLNRSRLRLNTYRTFLNGNIDRLPDDVWTSKSTLQDPLHQMGNLLRGLARAGTAPTLFTVVDQYEELPALNQTYGTELQRVVNTLIKARDPVAFVKIGARTHDWGQELRIWGADSRIEVQRDYVTIDLADLLMRNENEARWLFRELATDVAYRRLREVGRYKRATKDTMPEVFGGWSAWGESKQYFRNPEGSGAVVKGLPDQLRLRIVRACKSGSPLHLRLAAAWALEQVKHGKPQKEILSQVEARPWERRWWWKERVGVCLLQIASLAHQRKQYYGWKTILYLAGANIACFLLVCAEVWDVATKAGAAPLREKPLAPSIQTAGIVGASTKWRNRDRNEQDGGSKRYEVLGRLGMAIHDTLIGDLAVSNPGHSGFSLRESDFLDGSRQGQEVAAFLRKCVSWGILEEREHTSKERQGATRRKWYLHPLLSPCFGIPYIRSKEPFYSTTNDVWQWITGAERIQFGSKHKRSRAGQLKMPLEE